jgi:toxin CcdB
MAQFDVYVNNDVASQKLYPYLIDVQADILGHLPTRVVIPLLHRSNIKKPIPILNPIFKISDTLVCMSTPQLVGISSSLLSAKVCSLAEKRSEIIAALDLLFTGF